MLLCLDTSDGAGVALIELRQDRPASLLARGSEHNPRRHTESLSPLIHAALRDAGGTIADVTGIVVGTGPAPFTGLRVGIVTAQTMAGALNIPAYGVSALDGLARQVFAERPDLEQVLIATDARRKEIYVGHYAARSDQDVHALTGPAVMRPADLDLDHAAARAGAAAGRGVQLYPEAFEGLAALEVDITRVDPATLGRLALIRRQRDPAAEQPTRPLYLRRPDIHSGTNRPRAAPGAAS